MEIHLKGHVTEFAACGMAFDAHDSGAADHPIVFAESGERITCEECRRALDYYRTVKGYRAP